MECLASDLGHIGLGLVRVPSGRALLPVGGGGSGPSRRVRPEILSDEVAVTACSMYLGRLYVATSDGAVVALLDSDPSGRPYVTKDSGSECRVRRVRSSG